MGWHRLVGGGAVGKYECAAGVATKRTGDDLPGNGEIGRTGRRGVRGSRRTEATTRGVATIRGAAGGAVEDPRGYFRNHQVRGAEERVMGPSIRMGLAAMAATSFPFPVKRRLPAG